MSDCVHVYKTSEKISEFFINSCVQVLNTRNQTKMNAHISIYFLSIKAIALHRDIQVKFHLKKEVIYNK